MKYQRHLFKNVKNEQLLIVINFNSNNINQIIDDHFRKHQETTKIPHRNNLVDKQCFWF